MLPSFLKSNLKDHAAWHYSVCRDIVEKDRKMVVVGGQLELEAHVICASCNRDCHLHISLHSHNVATSLYHFRNTYYSLLRLGC